MNNIVEFPRIAATSAAATAARQFRRATDGGMPPVAVPERKLSPSTLLALGMSVLCLYLVLGNWLTRVGTAAPGSPGAAPAELYLGNAQGKLTFAPARTAPAAVATVAVSVVR